MPRRRGLDVDRNNMGRPWPRAVTSHPELFVSRRWRLRCNCPTSTCESKATSATLVRVPGLSHRMVLLQNITQVTLRHSSSHVVRIKKLPFSCLRSSGRLVCRRGRLAATITTDLPFGSPVLTAMRTISRIRRRRSWVRRAHNPLPGFGVLALLLLALQFRLPRSLF